MLLIITSDQSIETSYPLFKKGRAVPNTFLLGKRIVEREANRAIQAGFTDISIVYQGSVEVAGSLPRGTSVYWLGEAMDVIHNLKSFLTSSTYEKVVVQVGSFETNPFFYQFFLEKWKETSSNVFTLLTSTPTSLRYGLGELRALIDFQNNRVTEIRREGEGYGLTGIIGANKRLLLEQIESSKDLLDLVQRLLESTLSKAHVWPEDFVLLNEPRSYLLAIKTALFRYHSTIIKPSAKISPTAVIEGPVFIDEEAVIDHYAVIKGPVYIGPRVFVGSHSLIRNSVSIEPGAIIGSGAEIKRSYIGRNASIGSKCYIADSLIGEEAMIRPSCITINYDPQEAKRGEFEKMGSIIGEGSIIDSGSVLKPRTLIEPDTFYTK